jgi:hypothetical protein
MYGSVPESFVSHASLGEVSGRYSILRNAHEVVHHAQDAATQPDQWS